MEFTQYTGKACLGRVGEYLFKIKSKKAGLFHEVGYYDGEDLRFALDQVTNFNHSDITHFAAITKALTQ